MLARPRRVTGPATLSRRGRKPWTSIPTQTWPEVTPTAVVGKTREVPIRRTASFMTR
jgi:hypothetical protein